jgi:heptosyltransferase-1
MQILLVKTSSLGDVIHNLPVVSDLARRFPEAAIDWVVEESFAEVPRLHPAVRHVIPVAWRRWRRNLLQPETWREIGQFADRLKLPDYDDVLDSQGLLKSALIASLAPLPDGRKPMGYARGSARESLAPLFYGRRFTVPRELHAVLRNRRLAAAAFGCSADGPVDYGIAASPLAADWLPKGGYAVLLTATSRADKLWPEDHWQGLGMALVSTGLRCVLPGGNAEERQRAARLAVKIGRAVAAPAMNLADLAGLLAGAELVVGVDTGLVHLAAALGRPTLAIFCASDPALTGVLAGDKAVNLGSAGVPPKAQETVEAALGLLS